MAELDDPDVPASSPVPPDAHESSHHDGWEQIDDEAPAPAPRAGRASQWLGPLQGAFTFVVVAGTVLFVLRQFQPHLLLSNTTPAGGDMGAHVWAPAFLRDELLTQGRVAGWSGDWYAGFPAMQFYMVVPMLAIVALSYLVPYGVAFKLITVSGVVTMPASAYLFGRFTRLPFPVPAFMAVAAALFVFDRSFSIYGGNGASTLAGEFAFSISLSLAIVYLGVVGRGMAEGSHRGLAAILLALTGLCHVIPTFFAIVGTVVWFLAYLARDLLEAVGSIDVDRNRRLWAATRARAWWVASSAPVAGLLAAFWVLPFVVKSRYLNDMGWQKVDDYTSFLFWRTDLTGGLADHPSISLLLAVAVVGLLVSVLLRSPAGVVLAALVAVTALAFVYVPQGRLWNTRVLGFYYLSLGMLGAVGLGLLPRLLGRARPRRRFLAIATGLLLALQALLALAPGWLPIIGTIEVCDAAGTCVPEVGDVVWDPDRWRPYLIVGLLAVALAGAVEVATGPVRRRRMAAWGLLGVVGALQVAMRIADGWDTEARLVGWTLALLFVVAVAATAELIDSVRGAPSWVPDVWRLVGSAALVLVAWLYLALPLQSLGVFGVDADDGSYRLGLSFEDIELTTPVGTRDRSFVPGWATWNYRGYEATCPLDDPTDCGDGRKRWFPEYHAVVTTMARVGEEHGCGRAMWEYAGDLDRYGTPMALMLLPHWTDRCIGSMEGLYFEASTTTPFHFINQDELSEAGSNAQRGMPYIGTPGPVDFDRGVRHLQMLGVRYYLTYTDAMTGLARTHPDLEEIATSPALCLPENCPPDVEEPPARWVVFEVADSELVAPLVNEPVVLTGIGGGHTCETAPVEEDPRGRHCEGWLDPAVDWYTNDALWAVPFTEDGPDHWSRVPVEEWMATYSAPVRPLSAVEVDDIWTEGDELGFTVDRIGVPVVVRMSYFPNWRVDGAEGPYRISPNLMVVIPTEHEVRLHYGTLPIDVAAWALTFTGLGLLVVLRRRPPLDIPVGPVGVWHQRARARGSDTARQEPMP